MLDDEEKEEYKDFFNTKKVTKDDMIYPTIIVYIASENIYYTDGYDYYVGVKNSFIDSYKKRTKLYIEDLKIKYKLYTSTSAMAG